MYNEFYNNRKILAVFLDIAFDTVDHIKLINILPDLGIKNKNLNWFINYLKQKQMASINGVLCNENKITYGVPKGSVLDTILFIIYINNICNIDSHSKIIRCVDDMCLFFSSNIWECLLARIRHIRNEIWK